jgi:glutamate dehydrogenase/leucine dehydrogenase
MAEKLSLFKVMNTTPEFDNHQAVSFFDDEKTGLRAIVAIHNTNLGPATGGTRLYSYKNEAEALKDALKLSRAMTYKCALAGVNFGGGKAVIICTPKNKNKALMRSYGEKINTFGGVYTTGTDVGITQEDTEYMGESCPYILGLKNVKHTTGDMAALGVFYGIEAALEVLYGKADFKKRTVAIKGLGKLGGRLLELLYAEGATLLVAEKDKVRVESLKAKYPNITVVSPKKITQTVCDVYAPCAMGGDLSPESIKHIRAKIIAGGANNQLTEEGVGKLLHNQGILYIPDYVLNSGGLIHIVDELEKGGYSEKRVLSRIKQIKTTIQTIAKLSHKKKVPTNEIANMLAEKIIYKKKTGSR